MDLHQFEADLWEAADNLRAKRIKQLEEQRRSAVEQLKHTAHFHRHIVWLQDRFPNAQMQPVPGLVRVVMSGIPENFSFPSCRNLSHFLGEIDAMVELTELAARAFVTSARQSGNIPAFISNASSVYGIRVKLEEVDSFLAHLARSYIATVYSSAERFLHDFRGEHQTLYQREWSGDGVGVDPLTLALRNIPESEADAEQKVGHDIVSRFQFYRSVRNWIVHTKDPTRIAKAEAAFESITPFSPENEQLFVSLSAPHRPQAIDFDDFVFFSRLTKLLAARMCRVSAPPVEHWAKSGTFRDFNRLRKNPERMKNAISGKLRTDYGMDEPTARWIAADVYDSLA